MPASLIEEQSKSLLREKVLRMIFQRGFFKVGMPDLKLESLATEIYFPTGSGFTDARTVSVSESSTPSAGVWREQKRARSSRLGFTS